MIFFKKYLLVKGTSSVSFTIMKLYIHNRLLRKTSWNYFLLRRNGEDHSRFANLELTGDMMEDMVVSLTQTAA